MYCTASNCYWIVTILATQFKFHKVTEIYSFSLWLFLFVSLTICERDREDLTSKYINTKPNLWNTNLNFMQTRSESRTFILIPKAIIIHQPTVQEYLPWPLSTSTTCEKGRGNRKKVYFCHKWPWPTLYEFLNFPCVCNIFLSFKWFDVVLIPFYGLRCD